jgi:hypothetical protein
MSTLRVLDPGGRLVAVANTAKLSAEEHDKAIGDGSAPGFPEGNYLKCVVAVKM